MYLASSSAKTNAPQMVYLSVRVAVAVWPGGLSCQDHELSLRQLQFRQLCQRELFTLSPPFPSSDSLSLHWSLDVPCFPCSLLVLPCTASPQRIPCMPLAHLSLVYVYPLLGRLYEGTGCYLIIVYLDSDCVLCREHTGIWRANISLSCLCLPRPLPERAYRYPGGNAEDVAKNRSYFISELNFDLLEGAVVTGAA